MELVKLTENLGRTLQQKGLLLTTAESCTGGWLAEVITAVPGSSAWFERGFVTYSNKAKEDMLGVKADTIKLYGAVSEQTAKEMAEGAIKNSCAQVSIAITGIAGPGGGSPEKPVGTVWISWASISFATLIECYHFNGDRSQIRAEAVRAALEKLLQQIS